MILQELCSLYDRLAADPDVAVAPPGTFVQGVAFCVIISPDGTLKDIQDLRERDGNKLRNRSLMLPGDPKPSGSGLNPSLHGWDRTDYMLGYLDPEAIKPPTQANIDKKMGRCAEAHAKYKEETLAREREVNHPDYSAFCRFLESWDPAQADQYPVLKEVTGLFGVVRLEGKTEYLHELPFFRQQEGADEDAEKTMCLITGEPSVIARLHPKVKGVNGAQSSGASVVSFNLSAFESYGHEQNYNAPVSEMAAFKYATALNHLLERDGNHRMQVGDTTCVFWADKPTAGEGLLAAMFSGEDDAAIDESAQKALHASLESLKNGQVQIPDADVGFCILGLAPNAARLSVRFWLRSTLGDILGRVLRHQRELDIVRGKKDREVLPFWILLRQTARESKDIPPLLGGALARAVLTGDRYPEMMLSAVIRRIHADRDIRHSRAAIIKAILVRNHHKEDLVMLDPKRTEVGYQLGRLFAALERAQEGALPGINATIKDRYFGAASATPGTVFPRLIRMSQHHVAKLEGGAKVNTEKRMQEIVGRIDNYPAHLSLPEQGLFTLGYYHQRQDFFTSKKDANKKEDAE